LDTNDDQPLPPDADDVIRKFLSTVCGPLLLIVPSLVLLVVGLTVGILLAIVGYLLARIIVSTLRWKHYAKRAPWKERRNYLVLALGGVSLFTRDPLWFQLELTLTFVIIAMGLTVLLLRRRANAFSDLGIFDPEIVGRFHSTAFKVFFLAGLVLLSMANLWFALYQTDHAWLVFRSLAPATWFVCFTTFTAWSAFKNILTKASSGV